MMSTRTFLWSVVSLLCFVCPDSRAADFFSWEGDLEGWIFENLSGSPTATPKTEADGVPAAAITDGDYALELSYFTFGGWTQAVRGPGAYEDPPESGNWIDVVHASLVANTTIELDLFVPFEVGNAYNWARFWVQVEGQGMNFSSPITSLAGGHVDPEGNSYQIAWDYADDPNFNPNAEWAQVTLLTQGGDLPEISLAPIYVDNFRFTSAVVGDTADFDGDGDVDGADFLEWQYNYPNGGGGDADGDGDSDSDDLAIWEGQYGNSPAGTAVLAVPEPSSILLVSVSACALAVRRRR